ncbi:hypercellular protein A [Microdochium trichocladiopsis]|uniref:Hypercellular protein A n=1 Tax=Microdochium trichocladiopsis TaxID=1682393 RepID=A0A9P8Y9U2_9PEZI|nr:hypercellular protein A [Microdochium trichocladiopsis]KAH7033336.1 hypercellular protein A [Microdochium trichocladiopsis]
MGIESLAPLAPAKVRALVLPAGRIHKDRFAVFLERLNEQHVVHLRDISPDSRPNRTMFSPLGFPAGAMMYDLVTHVPPPSHVALSPFDFYREPLAVIAVADGKELQSSAFNKRQSANGHAPTMAERNIRALYQELESLRDSFPKVLTHHILIFDFEHPEGQEIPIPEGIKVIPPIDTAPTTAMKTVMCDMSSLILAEMTTLAKSFEAMTTVDSPGQAPSRPGLNGSSLASEDASMAARRNSQFALPTSGLSNPPTTFDELASSATNEGAASAPGSRPSSTIGIPEEPRSHSSQDKVSVQGFGPGGLNERWRAKGRGRITILVGSLYLQAGRWTDALKELAEGATVAKAMNDHLWHGKALDLIVVCLMLLGWANIEFQVPSVCLNPNEKSLSNVAKGLLPEGEDASQPRHLRNFQVILPDLLERIIGHYSRVTGEQLPPLPVSETIIRYSHILTTLHLYHGRFDTNTFEDIVFGSPAAMRLTTSPRLSITPSRAFITNFLFKAFPSSAPELLTNVDRAIILSGIASILGMLGFQRKKAMVLRELVSVLIGGLIEARTRGAADVGIHPAAGLAALNAVSGHGNGSAALDLGEGDIEHGIDAFLGILCKIYGVVEFDPTGDMSTKEGDLKDSDDQIRKRIESQAASRSFGFQHVKLNILRACINFSEALPDFDGVLRYSSDLLRTAGSGIAPGPRQEDAAPMITRDEQTRLVMNITKTADLSQRLGLGHLAAEYWDEFLIRGITMDPLPPAKIPIPHSKSVLPGVAMARTSQDVNPFIYNPFLRASDKAADARTLVANEPATFRVTIQNPYEVDLEIVSIKLDTQGADFESNTTSTVVGPYRTQILKLIGTPKAAGAITVVGAIVQIRGCRERRFSIFSNPWAPNTEIKIKGIGLSALEQSKSLPAPGPPLKCDSVGFTAVAAQPVIAVKSTSLSQSALMILEGERKVFTITLQNLSDTTPADLLLFSFQDSTQAPLQSAMGKRDATAAELYEYELVLSRKQAIRLRKLEDSKRFIAPGGLSTFEFEILGKPGLTTAVVQIDYAYLGVPQEEVTEQFHTRQVCVDLTVTVNASVELARLDILPIQGSIVMPAPKSPNSAAASIQTLSGEKNCLLMLDFRNAWPSDVEVQLDSDDEGTLLTERVLPGNTNRVILPIPRVYIDDPHAPIPALNPSRQRQFVVSTSKITPETERANREAFWFREKILQGLRGTWKTMSGASRSGVIELRGLRLAPRMIDVVKIDEVGIDIFVEKLGQPDSSTASSPRHQASRVLVDDFLQVRVRVSNRSSKPVYPLVRLLPSLRNRPANVALDFTRKFAWNGTLQQALPVLEGNTSTELVIGATALCRGEFEIAASVEETQLWVEAEEGAGSATQKPTTDSSSGTGGAAATAAATVTTRPRSGTDLVMANMLGAQERRIWHTRQPCLVTVCDD